MTVVEVTDLCKRYPSFQLNKVSFRMEEGHIIGFIGRNGAGKTTTIKSMLNLVHPDGGEVRYFGMPFQGNEGMIKARLGYSTGTISFYPRKKLKAITAVTKEFYPTWDEGSYRYFLDYFQLDEEKSPLEMSEGMKVKCNLLIALSHKAEVLILDEPTSGLDPFSRNELLDVFLHLKQQGISVLFSTHIISDLESCADDILYIRNGEIKANSSLAAFREHFVPENENLEQALLRLERGDIHD